MARNRIYVSLLLCVALLVVSWLVLDYRESRIYTIDQSDPMQFIGSWKPALNGTIEYGVALRAVAMRDSKTLKLLWVMKADEYPDEYLASAGFFEELKLSDNSLWLLVSDRTSKSQIAMLNLANKHLGRYDLPDQASIFSDTINDTSYWVVLAVTQDETEKLILYNLLSQETAILDTAPPQEPETFISSRWTWIKWVDDATLEYKTTKNELKRYVLVK